MASRLSALLSCRLNFHITSHALADELISDRLRYIVYEALNVSRTIQPSEPILDYKAAKMVLDAKTRMEMVEQFVKSSFEGSINMDGYRGNDCHYYPTPGVR